MGDFRYSFDQTNESPKAYSPREALKVDDIYRGIYRTLSDTTLSGPTSQAINGILDEITSTEPNLNLREDARHFLLLNFTQMVSEPLRLAGRTAPSELSNVCSQRYDNHHQ
ncbi:MAG: hypothetical protein ACJ71U_00595 [Terriglobales bacterium]